MLQLFYSPGACSMASHIALEEAGAEYTEQPTLIPQGEHRSEAYLKINPRGRVPALSVEGQVITENVAILTYVAKRYPQAKLWPADPLTEARCLSVMAWFSNTVHPSFAHIVRAERYADDATAQQSVKDTARKSFWANLQEIDKMLSGKTWLMGSQYTVADPYALVFFAWATRIELPVKELPAYSAFKTRMMQRPAVRKVLESEQSILLKAA